MKRNPNPPSLPSPSCQTVLQHLYFCQGRWARGSLQSHRQCSSISQPVRDALQNCAQYLLSWRHVTSGLAFSILEISPASTPDFQKMELAAMVETPAVGKKSSGSHCLTPAWSWNKLCWCKSWSFLPMDGVYIGADTPHAGDQWLNPKHRQGFSEKPMLLLAKGLQTQLFSCSRIILFHSQSICDCR